LPGRYTHIKEIEDEIIDLKESEQTNRAIAENFGLELELVKWLINRHNRTKRKQKYGILPKPKGSLWKDVFSQVEQKDRKIKWSLQRYSSTLNAYTDKSFIHLSRQKN